MKAFTILIVEDNPITRKMLRVALGAEGYSVLEAPDGRTALELVGKEPPDLILQDLLLPDMDGFELVAKLRKLPGGADIPILACSGFLSRLEASRAASSGFNDFIPKPVEPSRLLAVIQAYLPHPAANVEKPGQGRTLLLADDDPVQLKLSRLRLEELGFEVATASDGAEALQLARKSAPDVIVSDVLMPHMDGFQFCLAARQDRRLARVPVVLVSSNYIQESDRELATKLGASAYVFRTPDLDHLVRAVQKALREDSPPRARAPAEAVEEEHRERVLQQLDRQVTMNAGLLQRLGLQASMLSIMAGLSRALIRPGDVEEPLVELLDTVLDAGGVSLGALYLMDAHGLLRLRGQRGYPGPGNGDLESCFGHPEFIGQVLESESPLCIPSDQVPEKMGREFLERAGAKSSVLAPIVFQSNRLGVLLLASPRRDLTAREWSLFAQSIAFQIGQTITLGRAFAQLAASEARYRGLFERNLAGVFLTTLDGRILDCNDACARIFGYASREEALLHTVWEFYFQPEDREVFLARLREQKNVTNFEFRFRKKDASEIWALGNASLLEGEDGNPATIEGTLINITLRKQAQKKLEERTAYLDALIENSPLAIISHDFQGRIHFCNPAFERLFQYRSAEIIGRPVDQMIAAEESVSEAGEITRRVTGGDHVHRATRRRRKDGTLVDVELYGVPLTVGGQLVGAYGIYQDISERKRAEEALRRSEEQLRLALEAGHMGLWDWNLLTGQVTWSENLFAICGLGPGQFGGTVEAFLELMVPEDRPQVVYLIESAIRERTTLNIEFRTQRPDGRVCWLGAVGQVFYDTAGRPARVLGLGIDIGQQKRAEEGLRASEERFRDLFENALDIIYTHNLEGRFTSFNKAAEQVLGYSRDEALTMKVNQVLAPEYFDLAGKMLALKLAGQPVTVYEVEFVTRHGRRVSVEVSTRLIYKQDQPDGVQVNARDITERRRLEEQLRQSQKMEAVGQLAGGVAHDFNNLLTVIKGYGDILLEELPAGNERLRRAAEEIYRSADRAADLTRQLLAFSRRQVLEPKVLDLNDVVAGMDKMLRRLIGEHIELLTVRKPGLGRVKSDPGQIEQVIVNLAVNARDAMPDGGKLTLETANVELDETYAQLHIAVKAGPHVMLAVSDTGCGMDGHTLTRIFEPFFTTKEPGKGTGLGLSTVYGIVKQSGGNIWVYSEPGGGTTFKVYLPRVEEAAEALPAERPRPVAARGSEMVLLVEDEAPLRALIHLTLERHGYRLLEAQDATDALRIAEQHREPIDLLLTDVVMPQMGGPALAELVMPMHPETRVLYISGYTDDAIVHHGVLDAGVAFLQKPFSAADLTRKIRQVLEAHDVK